jgi:hypothetical protein
MLPRAPRGNSSTRRKSMPVQDGSCTVEHFLEDAGSTKSDLLSSIIKHTLITTTDMKLQEYHIQQFLLHKRSTFMITFPSHSV